MDFLNRLFESEYFGIGLFAVIAFLVVTFLVVLFFGKKDEKKRKLESTSAIEQNTFKETSTSTAVEIPTNPEPVAPINLETLNTSEITEPVNTSSVDVNSTPSPVAPVMPVPPIEPTVPIEEDAYVDNLTIEESVTPTIIEPQTTPSIEVPTPVEMPKTEPVITPVTPIINEPIKEEPARVELEPIKFELPKEPVTPIINEEVKPIINEPVIPIIKEEEPKLQINEEPVINTYYKPVEKTEPETIKVPNIDYDSLARSISEELDELEKDSRRHEELKVTPINEVIAPDAPKNPSTFSSVYVKPTPKEMPKETIELPKRIDLPARKSE